MSYSIRKIRIICQECGKTIFRETRGTKFCFECSGERAKAQQRERDRIKREGYGNECIFCGLKMEHIHHADMDRKNNNKSNLLPLCIKCHKKVHALIIKPILKRYGKRNKTKIK